MARSADMLAFSPSIQAGDLSSVLTDNLATVVYPAGSTIFLEGEEATCAYLIEEGRVEITVDRRHPRHVLAILGAGELLGEMAPIDQSVRSATATAVEQTRVIPIGRGQLNDAIRSADPIVQLLVHELLRRLRNTQYASKDEASGSLHGQRSLVESPEESEDVVIRGNAVEHIKMEKNLRQAIDHREFVLSFQPIIHLEDDSIAGFEALIRWHSPAFGLVSPAQFIPVAEDSGLIIPIGLWVLEHACYMYQRFQARFDRCFPGLPPLFINANVSARQLRSSRDIEAIVATIEDTGIDTTRLKLEITEGILVENPEMAAVGLRRFKEVGVKLAIDDFGTGHSGLSYLNRYPLDVLKIDRSFVNTMLERQSSEKIVRAVIALAHELEMEVVAEGVESWEELCRLRDLGCEYVQGYLYSRPLPATEIMTLLDSPSAWHQHISTLPQD